MSVDSSLAYGRHQPFYTVLLSDGSRRYVAEENIQVLFREYRHGVDAVQMEGHDQSSLSSSSLSSSSATLSTLVQSTGVGMQADVEDIEAGTEAGVEEDAAPALAPALTAAAATTVPTTPTPSVPPLSELGPLGIEAVGQYFESWDGQQGHYVMNRELIRVYPTEDYL